MYVRKCDSAAFTLDGFWWMSTWACQRSANFSTDVNLLGL
jgi:hypothetical protein